MKSLLPILGLVVGLAAGRAVAAEKYVFAALPDSADPVASAPAQVQAQVQAPTNPPALTNHAALDELIKNLPSPVNPPPILPAIQPNSHAAPVTVEPAALPVAETGQPEGSNAIIPAPVQTGNAPAVRPEPATVESKPARERFVFAPLPTNSASPNISYDLIANRPAAAVKTNPPAPAMPKPAPFPPAQPPAKTNRPAMTPAPKPGPVDPLPSAPTGAESRPPTSAELFAARQEMKLREHHTFAPLPTLSDVRPDIAVQYDAVKDVIPPPASAPEPRPSPPMVGKRSATLDSAKAKLIVSPAHELDGTVMAVDARGRFVVLNFPLGQMPAVDAVLLVYRHGVKVGEVKVTGPQRDDNTMADVLSGDLQVDDDARD